VHISGICEGPSDRSVVTIVYSGEKGDFGFNDQVYLGYIRARDDMHFLTRELSSGRVNSGEDPFIDIDNGLRSDLILLIGDTLTGYGEELSHTYSDVPIIIIDSEPVNRAMVRTVSFKMSGASFLAGVLAANETKSGKIGVIAGKDANVISSFIDGFTAGVNQKNSSVRVYISYLACDDSGFDMPDTAGEIAEQMYANGTDIILVAAGGSDIGVIYAAKRLPGLSVIGVDADKSLIGPGIVIGSVVKNLDYVVYNEIELALSGKFSPEPVEYNLLNGGSSFLPNSRMGNYSWVITDWSEKAKDLDQG